MRALSESRGLRWFVFTALYFAQGLPWGFISVGYVVFMTDQGLSSTAIGAAMGVAYLPWSFKWIAGPFLDAVHTRFGRRRPFIIGAEAVMGLSLLLLLLIEPTNLQAISIVLFVHNCAAALQDVAVDALAVDLLHEDERGRANSFMWAGKSAGVALGGGGGALIAKWFGWPALFILLAAAIWVIMVLPIVYRERTEEQEAEPIERLSWRTLWGSFNFPAPWVTMLIAFVTPAGYALIGPVFTKLIRSDVGLGEEAIALLTGVVDPVAGVAGALLGGFVADRVGPRRAMGGFMVGVALCLATFGLSEGLWPSMAFLICFQATFAFTVNAYNAASFGFFMAMANPAVGATQFAIYMAMTNLTYSATAPAGGWVADSFGYVALFVTAAVVQVVSIAVLPLARPDLAAAHYHAVGGPAVDRAPAG